MPHAFPSDEQTDLPGVGHVPVVNPAIEGMAAAAVDCVGGPALGPKDGGAAILVVGVEAEDCAMVEEL